MNLLEIVKARLKITWESQDLEILDLIEDAKIFIENRVGIVDWSHDQSSVRVLKEYCRYAWNGSAALFESDFRSDLLNLQINKAVERKMTNEMEQK